MDSPIVYVDHSDIRPGKLDELKAALRELAAFVEEHEPELVSYAAYIDEAAGTVSVTHVHRDVASLDTHFEVAGPRFGPFAAHLELRSIDVFGAVSDAASAALHEKARALGGARVRIHPPLAGFLRT